MAETVKSEGIKGRSSGIGDRSVVIHRTGTKGGRGVSSMSMRSSMGMGGLGGNMSPGTIQQLSNSGVSEFKGTRQKEKRDLRDLNERLAGYIDKVQYLSANIKELEAENAALRNRKTEDFEPIRKAYENELAQARKVIDDLASNKGREEAKVAGLQDEIDSLRELIATYESQAKDYKKKIEALNNQNGEYEGEISTLRSRVNSLEDENAKIRELLTKAQDQCKRLRADLDTETAAHIEADCMAQTKAEEAEFYKDLCNEMELCKPEPLQIKGMGHSEFWKSEMQKALRDINSVYEEKLELIQNDCENKYATQINSLRNGNVKDGMQLGKAQEEVKRMKMQMSDKNGQYQEMASKLIALQAERDELARQLGENERELESQRLKYNQDVGDLQEELTQVLAQLQNLMDAKMSLELEIACYKRLLEGEESRVGLRSMVESALDTQTRGSVSASLADALNAQSIDGGKKKRQDEEEQSGLKESTGSLTVQRSSKGPICFKSMDHSGGNVVIENSSSGARSRNQKLKGWRVVKTVNSRNIVDVALNDFELLPGKIFTVFAKGAKNDTTREDEQIVDTFSFGVGTCIWKLLDDHGNEKATLRANFIS